ncbi:uncharacterized protein LOC142984379 isoform X8 [Anticarsia gemmatalis]|uniref:uncharacterized protein LOC142973574 isoform X8 n=1 Tax=Anticarsia gemmatalis TaxID=129554 RepID=UPI003F765530
MPTLFESKLGWLISGGYYQHSSAPQLCMLTDSLHTELTRFWELDSIDSKHKFTAEERACEQSFVDTTTRNPDGRFVVNIPLKESPDVLVVQKCRRVVEILHSAQYNLRKWQSNSPEIEHLKITNLQRFRRIEQLKQHFWTRFSNDYVLWLQERTKWRSSTGELKEGTLVVIKDKGLPPLMWLLGRIVRVLPGKDGIARVADIRTRKGVLRRAFNTICPLPVDTTSNVEDTSTGGVC